MSRRVGLLAAAVALLLAAAQAAALPQELLDLPPPGQPALLPPGLLSAWPASSAAGDGRHRRALAAAEAASAAPNAGATGIITGASPAQPEPPLCEFNLRYRVVDLDPASAGFSSILTLQNNRELATLNWQVVFMFADYTRVRLRGVDGAIPLSLGSTAGAPVRVVDTFTTDGIPGGAPCWVAGCGCGVVPAAAADAAMHIGGVKTARAPPATCAPQPAAPSSLPPATPQAAAPFLSWLMPCCWSGRPAPTSLWALMPST